MNRPASIVMFERLYLASLAVWLVGTIVFWAQLQLDVAIAAAHAPANIARVFPVVVDSMVALVGIVTLLLWYSAARRASLTAAWIVIITEAFGALSLVWGLVRRTGAGTGFQASGYVNMAATILAVVAAAFLLRADAQQWLNGKRRTPGIEPL